MRSQLFALTLLALTLGAVDEAKANRRLFGGTIKVTNKTPFAVRVWIRQGPRLLKSARLQPMESVESPRVRLGSTKDPNDIDHARVDARGLEGPIRGQDTESVVSPITDQFLPQPGEVNCYDVTTLLIGADEEQEVILFDVENGDCDDDPEDPEDPEYPDETTGQLGFGREGVTMIASTSGLAFLGLAGYLLGRAPRRKEEDDQV